MLKGVVIGTKVETIILMIKLPEDKKSSGVVRKVTQSLIVHKAIRKTKIKGSIEEAMTTSTDLVYPVNQSSMTLVG